MAKEINIDKLNVGSTLSSLAIESKDIKLDGVSIKPKFEKLDNLPDVFVKSVNGVEPDPETGNIQIQTGKSFSIYIPTTTPSEGAEKNIYTIYDFVDFINEVNDKGNNYKAKTINLCRDLDLGPLVGFHGIGVYQKTDFCGYFNGNGHTLYNVNIDPIAGFNTERRPAGLFVSAGKSVDGSGEGSRIMNLNINGITIPGNVEDGLDRWRGSILGYSGCCVIENCHVTNGKVTAKYSSGGLVGFGYTNILSSSFDGEVEGNWWGVGGLIGMINPSGGLCDAKIIDCKVSGKLKLTVADDYLVNRSTGIVLGQTNCDAPGFLLTNFTFTKNEADMEMYANGTKVNGDLIGAVDNNKLTTLEGTLISNDNKWSSRTHSEARQEIKWINDQYVLNPTGVFFDNTIG